MNRKELLAKVRDAAKSYGAKTELAHALGYTRQTILNKLKQEDGFTDEELKKAAAALIGAEAEHYLEEVERRTPGLEERQAPYAGSVDVRLLHRVIYEFEEMLRDHKLDLPPYKKADMIVWVYEEEVRRRAAGQPRLPSAEIIQLVRAA